MDISTFITAVFCLVDDWLKGRPKLRQRGPSPELSDSEVLTIEIVGEYLGIDTEKGLHAFTALHLAGAISNPVAKWTLARLETPYPDPTRCPECAEGLEQTE